MFERERTLFFAVALDARCICPDSQFGLFRFKTAVRIMTIAAFHRTFQHFVVERFRELRFCLGVAANAQLSFARFEPQG